MTAHAILTALMCSSGACSCAAAARRGSGLTHCPSHADDKPSLNVTDKDGRVLVHCHGTCEQSAVLDALRERKLWGEADEPAAAPQKRSRTVEATHKYVDERLEVLYEVVRFSPKGFSQRRPDGTAGWIYNLEGVRRVLYNLPTVIAGSKRGERIYVVEGEKDADAIIALGLTATTSSGGAGKWRPEYAESLRGAELVVIADKDAPGRAHAQTIARSCRGTAKSVKVLELPGEQVKDASDFLSAGGTEADLERIADEAPAGDPKKDASGAANGTQRTSQASRLVELCADVELFHARDGEAYGTVAVNDHHETWPVRSSVFRDFLRRRYFDAQHAVPGAQPLGEAVDLIAARARFSGETRDVDLRLAGHEGRIYLDLCNDDWQVVEIGPDNWRVVADAPVRFRRARGMLPLPTPTPDGSLELLRPFLNVGDDQRRWKLIVGWLVGLFRPSGPHALLAVSGEQGSAKTTQGRILRALHDPNESPDRTTPRSELDLAIAARNARIIVLDNLSGLKPWLSDGLARLATGSGLTTRKLYTDDEETIFHACRPILLNGIAEVPTRSDLLDRSLVVDLPRIPDERRQLESDLWPAFELARPAILGALLTAASCALAHERTVTLPGWPRMADFARWVTAAEPALGWPPGSFMEAYTTNRAASHELALDFAAIYAPLQVLIDTDAWQGTASQLLAALAAKVEDAVIRQEGWPKSPRALSALLRDLAPNLRAVGIGTEFSRQSGNGRRRLITITKTTDRDRPDRPEDTDAQGNEGEAGTQRDAEADLRDANPEPTVPVSEPARDGRDARDARDANGGLIKDGAEPVGEPAVREASPEREMARFEL